MPTEFSYQYDMDENGALYFLATLGKTKTWQNPHTTLQVQAFASSIGAGMVDDFVGRIATNCRTQNDANSYFGVDLGDGRRILPTCYTIRNRNSTSHCLMNWQFEVSNDKVNWQVLDRRIYMTGVTEDDLQFVDVQKELCQKGQTSTWGIDSEIYRQLGFDGYRFLRIV